MSHCKRDVLKSWSQSVIDTTFLSRQQTKKQVKNIILHKLDYTLSIVHYRLLQSKQKNMQAEAHDQHLY